MIITGKYPNLRMRRSRKNSWSRRLVQENSLSYNDLILPIFLTDGSNQKIPIKSMPNIYRYSIDRLSKIIDKSIKKKIPMVALFPQTKIKLKNPLGSEALKQDNFLNNSIYSSFFLLLLKLIISFKSSNNIICSNLSECDLKIKLAISFDPVTLVKQ